MGGYRDAGDERVGGAWMGLVPCICENEEWVQTFSGSSETVVQRIDRWWGWYVNHLRKWAADGRDARGRKHGCASRGLGAAVGQQA